MVISAKNYMLKSISIYVIYQIKARQRVFFIWVIIHFIHRHTFNITKQKLNANIRCVCNHWLAGTQR